MRNKALDRTKWLPWVFVCDDDTFRTREDVIAFLPANAVMASSNTTVILERMVRRGRVEWYDKQKRAAIRRQFKRGGA